MQVRGKLGTFSSDVFEVKRKRSPLKTGDKVEIRSKYDTRCLVWTRSQVEKVNPDGFVFFSFA